MTGKQFYVPCWAPYVSPMTSGIYKSKTVSVHIVVTTDRTGNLCELIIIFNTLGGSSIKRLLV